MASKKPAEKAAPAAPARARSAAPKPEFAFDAASLAADVAAGPTAQAAAEMFAADAVATIPGAASERIKKFDPAWITLIVQAVMAIVQQCPRKDITEALQAIKQRPSGLRARFVRFRLARSFPGRWGADAEDVARAMIGVAVNNVEGDLMDAFYPGEVSATPDEGAVGPLGAAGDPGPPGDPGVTGLVAGEDGDPVADHADAIASLQQVGSAPPA
jgi:hypothetical protein